jgi:hypothetical protein
VRGGHSSVVDSGTGNRIVLRGDNDSVTLAGASATVTCPGAGSTIDVTGSGSMIDADNASITLADGVSATVKGRGETIGMGNDSHLTVTGDVKDVLHAGGTADILSFGGNVAYNQLWFARSDDDLIISEIGRDRSVTVTDWYDSPVNHVDLVTTGDGYSLSDGGVEQLVQAMAAFTTPAAGQTHLPHALAANLAPTLAANWHHP